MVAVGERRWPDPHLPPEESLELLQADYAAATAEVELEVLTPGLRLTPGGHGELQLRVTNRLASELHGEAQLVSPFGSWQMLGPWTQGFGAGPQESVTVRFTVSVPATERPGSQSWALVKVMYFGRVRYTESVPVVIEPGN
jgi:alpha-mannosidase